MMITMRRRDSIYKEHYRMTELTEIIARVQSLLPGITKIRELSGQEEAQADKETLFILRDGFFAPESFSAEKLKKLHASGASLLTVTTPPLDSLQIYRLLSGRETEALDIRGLTGAGVCRLLKEAGYTLARDLSVKKDYRGTGDGSPFTAKGSLVNSYLRWLAGYTGSGIDNETDIYLFTPGAVPESVTASPFLSVIIRTTGNRNIALQEALLSLAGQKDMDFEVVLVGHRVSEENKPALIRLVDSQPGFLKNRIRLLFLEEGGRAAPLNFGFSQARGIYAAVLDDDDFVFENWVSAFKNTAEAHPGAIVHSKVLMQDWERYTDESGKEVLRAVGSFDPYYGDDYDWLLQMFTNTCPFNGLAFPLFPFKEYGIRFNEEYSTTEDWDFLQRMSAVCGVADTRQTTCVYRIWVNAENSHVLHDREEWNRNRTEIIRSMYDRPILLPAEKTEGVIDLVAAYPESFRYGSVGNFTERQITSKLYFSTEKCGFTEETAVALPNLNLLPDFYYRFEHLEDKGRVTNLRWDPMDYRSGYCTAIELSVEYADGTVEEVNVRGCDTNGFWLEDDLVFCAPDPQVIYHLPTEGRVISSVTIAGRLSLTYTPKMKDLFLDKYAESLTQPTKKKGLLNKLFH